MPYDESLADRVRKVLSKRRSVTERKMFGGLAFLLNGNMFCGVEKSRLVVRVGPEQYESALKQSGVGPMDFTGRPLKGFVYVSPKVIQKDAALGKWLKSGMAFAGSLPKKEKGRA